ncbi:MAG: hypothetical protein AB9869_36085 [Verrucomicrobiia bacterium]
MPSLRWTREESEVLSAIRSSSVTFGAARFPKPAKWHGTNSAPALLVNASPARSPGQTPDSFAKLSSGIQFAPVNAGIEGTSHSGRSQFAPNLSRLLVVVDRPCHNHSILEHEHEQGKDRQLPAPKARALSDQTRQRRRPRAAVAR